MVIFCTSTRCVSVQFESATSHLSWLPSPASTTHGPWNMPIGKRVLCRSKVGLFPNGDKRPRTRPKTPPKISRFLHRKENNLCLAVDGLTPPFYSSLFSRHLQSSRDQSCRNHTFQMTSESKRCGVHVFHPESYLIIWTNGPANSSSCTDTAYQTT